LANQILHRVQDRPAMVENSSTAFKAEIFETNENFSPPVNLPPLPSEGRDDSNSNFNETRDPKLAYAMFTKISMFLYVISLLLDVC